MENRKPGPPGAAAGRVGRPRRLSTAEIVSTATELADERGLAGLSMPKLAERLGVGTMTLYGYVESKEDLLDRIAGKIFEELRLPEGDDWRQVLVGFFVNFRNAALAHPVLAQLLPTGRITIPAVFEILETSIQQMADDGVPVETAVRTFYAGLAYTMGFVLWEIPRVRLQDEAEYARQWADLLAQLDPDEFPILRGPAGVIAPTVASADQFQWGLRRVLDA